MAIIDSSIWIEAARRGGALPTRVAFEALLEEYETATTSPVLGGARVGDFKRMSQYFSIIPYFPADVNNGNRAIALAWHLQVRGIRVPLNDILIATAAKRRDLRVFAEDEHFETMSQCTALSLYRACYGGTYSPENRGGEGI